MARQTNAAYWAQRMKNMEDALLDQSFSYVENLEKQFAAAQAEIERQMARWYQRFATNNEIDLAEAKRLLNSKELKEFHWTVAEYIAYGEQNAIDGAWMKQLENASARVHISRAGGSKAPAPAAGRGPYTPTNWTMWMPPPARCMRAATITRPLNCKRGWAWAGPCRPSMRKLSPRCSPAPGPRTTRLSVIGAGQTSRAL